MRVFHFLTAAQNGSAVPDSFVRIRGGMQISGRESALPFFPLLSQFPTGPADLPAVPPQKRIIQNKRAYPSPLRRISSTTKDPPL